MELKDDLATLNDLSDKSFQTMLESFSYEKIQQINALCQQELFRRKPKHPVQILKEWAERSTERSVEYVLHPNKSEMLFWTWNAIVHLFDHNNQIETFTVVLLPTKKGTGRKLAKKMVAEKAISESVIFNKAEPK